LRDRAVAGSAHIGRVVHAFWWARAYCWRQSWLFPFEAVAKLDAAPIGAWRSPANGGGKDIFVHISAVERAGLSSLNEGQVVQYEEVSNQGRSAAENLRVSR
jgi:cold shock CspA family protein